MTKYSTYIFGRNDFEINPQAIEVVPVETCGGFGEAWHAEVPTENGLCPICKSISVTYRPKQDDKAL